MLGYFMFMFQWGIAVFELDSHPIKTFRLINKNIKTKVNIIQPVWNKKG